MTRISLTLSLCLLSTPLLASNLEDVNADIVPVIVPLPADHTAEPISLTTDLGGNAKLPGLDLINLDAPAATPVFALPAGQISLLK